MYIDIDRLQQLHDIYGYARGDRAITFLAGVLGDAARDAGVPGVFVGHVGGDELHHR